MLLRFSGLTALITIVVFGLYLFLLVNLPSLQIEHLPRNEGLKSHEMPAHLAALLVPAGFLYMSLSVGWAAAYSILFRFPERFRYLTVGILCCAPILALAFQGGHSAVEIRSETTGVIVMVLLVLVATAIQLLAFVIVFHAFKAGVRTFRTNFPPYVHAAKSTLRRVREAVRGRR